jgi:hypothetical protein
MTEIIKSAYEGKVTIGEAVLECHVLEDERRIFSRKDFLYALNLKFDPKEERKIVQLFLDRINFISIIGDQALYKTLNNPIKFKKGNFIAYGYPAELLAEVCNAILALAENRMLPVDFEIKKPQNRAANCSRHLPMLGLPPSLTRRPDTRITAASRHCRIFSTSTLKRNTLSGQNGFPMNFTSSCSV